MLYWRVMAIHCDGLSAAAVVIRNERGEEGPICPRHIREAYRRAVRSKRLPVLRGTSITDLPR